MKLIKKIFYVFDVKQKLQLGVLSVAIIIGAVLELLGVTAVLPFINALTNQDKLMEKWYVIFLMKLFGIESEIDLIILFALLIIIVYIVKNAYLVFLGNMQYRFISGQQRKLSTKLLDVYMRQNYLFHLENSSVELHRNITGDTQTFFRTLLAALQILTDALICLTLFLFLFSTDILITLVLTILMGGYIAIYIAKFKKKILFYGEKNRRYSAIITKLVLQALNGIKETKILNKEKFFVRYYDKNYDEYIDAQRKNNLLSLIPKALLETICVGGLLIVVCIKLKIGTDLKYFMPIISTFAVAAFRMLPSFNKISGNIGILLYGVPSIDALYDDMRRLKYLESKDKEELMSVSNKTLEFINSITVENVSFKYPNTTNIVLDKINLMIKKNASVALIGPSGAGKTTLADLILGVLEPCEGNIFIDSININNCMAQWHAKLGYIPQNIFLMDDTLKRNIAYGVPDEAIDINKIWSVLELAQLKEFVMALDNGLDTKIGEFGARLSGGQRQRIGIARALYNDPEVLVLDEATSALDNDTESAVMDAVSSLVGTKTLIIIAHRLSTIEQCNAVYKIENYKLEKVR